MPEGVLVYVLIPSNYFRGVIVIPHLKELLVISLDLNFTSIKFGD